MDRNSKRYSGLSSTPLLYYVKNVFLACVGGYRSWYLILGVSRNLLGSTRDSSIED